jgi:hypothetical protein
MLSFCSFYVGWFTTTSLSPPADLVVIDCCFGQIGHAASLALHGMLISKVSAAQTQLSHLVAMDKFARDRKSFHCHFAVASKTRSLGATDTYPAHL